MNPVRATSIAGAGNCSKLRAATKPPRSRVRGMAYSLWRFGEYGAFAVREKLMAAKLVTSPGLGDEGA
jgi:hypothetical protein